MSGKHALARQAWKPWRRKRLTMAAAVALMSLTAVTVTGSAATFTDSANVAANNFTTGTIAASASVSATATGPGLFSLTWAQSTSGYAAGYDIQRSTAAAGPWESVGTVSGRATTSFVDGVPDAGQWFYRISTVFNNWTGSSATYTAPAVQLHPVGTWGKGDSGEIGNGAFDNQTRFTGMLGPAGKNLTSVASGYGFSCGLFAGEAYCWGLNNYGQLGDGTTTNSAKAVKVLAGAIPAGATITKISGGNGHACALAGGKAYCWGLGTSGQLGNGLSTSSSTPVLVGGQLAGLTVTDISAGSGHTCGVAAGGAYCWGSNSYGRLGTGNTTNAAAPVKVVSTGVLSGKTVTAISTGGYHTCSIASGGAFCWGYGASGQLGQGSLADSSVPVAVASPLTAAVSIVSSGYYSTCALAAGVAYCWGNGNDGNLGNGGTADSAVPVRVTTTGVLSGRTISSIVSGYSHACTLASGKASCWGSNAYGQIGDGTLVSRSAPVDSQAPTISALTARYYHTLALLP